MSRQPIRVGDRLRVRGTHYLVVGIKSSSNLGTKFYGKGRVYLRDVEGNEFSVYCSVPATNISNCKPQPINDYEQQFIAIPGGRS